MATQHDPAQDAAIKIQARYRSFRKKRQLAGLALSKTDWSTLLNQVNIVLRTSQFEDAHPKQLSVRGKWVRGLGSAGAIGRVWRCYHCMPHPSPLSCTTQKGVRLQGSADGDGGLLLRKEHW